MSDSDEWFPGANAVTEAEVRFLRHLRELAPDWIADGLSAGRSMSVPVHKPFVGVELPHLSVRLRWLWVLFLDSTDGFVIDCEWGDTTHFNDWGPIDGNLYASMNEVDPTPERSAEKAAQWVSEQARRPMLREDWGGRRPRSRWSFADTGASLYSSGPWLWRRNTPPERTRIERVGA